MKAKICVRCETVLIEGAAFCHACGTDNEFEAPLPYVGELLTKAVYRLTFNPVEATFTSADGAREAAGHSFWNEDREFSGCTVERLHTAVPKEEYPYICGKCEEVVDKGGVEGRCQSCGASNAWRERD